MNSAFIDPTGFCCTETSKEFIYLTLMASWLVKLPWDREKPYDVIEFFAGVARVSRLAQLCGYNSRAYELEFDKPPTGESRHAGRARRSAFDINGEGGFVPLSYE